MARDPKNKTTGWFKGVLSNQSEPIQANQLDTFTPVDFELIEGNFSSTDEPIVATAPMGTDNPSISTNNKLLFTKENMDKVSLDIVVALENLLSDRQLMMFRNDDLDIQLRTANDAIHRLKYDLARKEQQIQEKNNEVMKLESSLSSKQMSYDQLFEDYKEYQNNAAEEFDKVSSQLEKEMNKYNLLKEESSNIQNSNLATIRDLEEQVRELDTENKKLAAQCDKILAEKAELMRTIQDFTERMNFSFSKPSNSSSTES